MMMKTTIFEENILRKNNMKKFLINSIVVCKNNATNRHQF